MTAKLDQVLRNQQVILEALKHTHPTQELRQAIDVASRSTDDVLERTPPTQDASAPEAEPEPCPYCNGVYTGLPGNACENCMGTGLANPAAARDADAAPASEMGSAN